MSLKIRKRGKIWHYSGTVANRRLRGTTGTADKATAQRIAAEIEKKAWTSHLDGPGAHLTFAQAAIAYRGAGKSHRFLEPIEDYWRGTLISRITPGVVRESARHLYPNVKGATLNRQVIVPTQAIINHCAELEWCNRISVRRFKSEPKTKEPVDREWVDAFVKHSSTHLGAICLFMYGTGARISEATNLTWNDVNLESQTALIRQTKVGSERIAHLPQTVIVALANIEGERRATDKVFKYSSRDTAKPSWKAAVARAGIEQLSFHSCRHGFATTLLHRGFDVKTIAKLGGWKDATQVLKTYGHALEDPTLTDAIFGTDLTHIKLKKSIRY